MSGAARSLYVFGIYMIFLGMAMFAVPNLMLIPLGFPEVTQPWIRVGASLVCVVGYYYIVAARNELVPFFRATVLGRHLILLAFLILVLLGHFRWQLLLFAIPDQFGAFWTTMELKRLPSVAPAQTQMNSVNQ